MKNNKKINNIKLEEKDNLSPHTKKHINSEPEFKELENGNYIDINENNKNENDKIEIPPEMIKEYSILRSLLLLIHEKKLKLIQTKNLLELKYNKYKKCYTFWNIFTISLSSLLTLIESSKLVFLDDVEDYDDTINNFFKLSPILLGTSITCSASIIKFKKYQEQMEELYIVIDKCIGMISKLKSKKDEILLLKTKENQLSMYNKCKTDNFKEKLKLYKQNIDTIHETFKSDILKEFSVVYHETEKYINYNDYNKYLSIINNIEYKKHILREEKNKFYENYKHKIEDGRIEDIKHFVINEKPKLKNCCGFQY